MSDDALKKALTYLLEEVETKDIEDAISGYKAKLNSDIRKKVNESLKTGSKKIVF